MRNRGILTPAVQEAARNNLYCEISQAELRLMPYIHHTLINSRRIDPNRINPDERTILSDWRKKGWLSGGAGSDIEVTKEFYRAMNEVIWAGYVAFDEEHA